MIRKTARSCFIFSSNLFLIIDNIHAFRTIAILKSNTVRKILYVCFPLSKNKCSVFKRDTEKLIKLFKTTILKKKTCSMFFSLFKTICNNICR